MSDLKKTLMKPEALIDMGYTSEQLRDFAGGLIRYLDTIEKPKDTKKVKDKVKK